MDCVYAFRSQRHKEILSQKGKAVASSRESLGATDSFRPVTEPTVDSDDAGLATNINSRVIHSRLRENQQQERQAEPNPKTQDFSTTSETSTGSTDQELLSMEDATVLLFSGVQERAAEPAAGDGGVSEPGAAAEDANEEGEKEVPVLPGKNSNPGKAKTAPKRRSGRAANRH